VKKIAISMVLAMVIMMAGAMTAPFLQAGEPNMEGIFPALKGWAKKGAPTFYTPDNLFEYINGAAEVFLSYDFQKLGTLTYENKEKMSFTVDVYKHNGARNGFGIYSQEKPQEGSFLPIGTQGYYEKGVLNFLKGSFYVKMSGYDLGDKDKDILTSAANAIAGLLKGENSLPAVLNCFPTKGKKSNSERYINKNFLGHSFLHSAYVVDYENDGRTFQIFIIEAANPAVADKVLQEYKAFLEKKGKDVTEKDGIQRFQDPYYRSSGTMHMKKSKNYIWGLFFKNDTIAKTLIDEIETKLKKNKLI
jgi:hypothetical protein